MARKQAKRRRREETPEEIEARLQRSFDKAVRVGRQLHAKKGRWYEKWKASMKAFGDSLEIKEA